MQRRKHSNLLSVHLVIFAGHVTTHPDQLPAVDLRRLEVLEVVAHGTQLGPPGRPNTLRIQHGEGQGGRRAEGERGCLNI